MPTRPNTPEPPLKYTVGGFKSIAAPQTANIPHLTVLAGANSSGKTSFMQPLLLMKQTIEAGYDPGTFLLDGPNAKFTSTDQLVTRDHQGFSVSLSGPRMGFVKLNYIRHPARGLTIESLVARADDRMVTLNTEMTHEDVLNVMPSSDREVFSPVTDSFPEARWHVIRRRCFLTLMLTLGTDVPRRIRSLLPDAVSPAFKLGELARRMIHLPGTRGNPGRLYPGTSAKTHYPGTFEPYVAGILARWTDGNESKKKIELDEFVRDLGLAASVSARWVDEASVEVKVGLRHTPDAASASEARHIADVGFGVSQALPVLVALVEATRDQVVYIEQPEIHLHPRAQYRLAFVLATAARRGVRVVVETHSSILLLGVQTAIATEKIDAGDVALHWFGLGGDGYTNIHTATIDAAGTFGDWPSDFDGVYLEAQKQFLDASMRR